MKRTLFILMFPSELMARPKHKMPPWRPLSGEKQALLRACVDGEARR